jgi:predicted transcriptional regulator
MLPDENEICMCNMKSLFDKATINLLKKEIKTFKENGRFHTPVSAVQVAALIHHVTKRTIKEISSFSGISPDTINKAIKQLNF